MRAVHIGIRHDNNLVIPQLADIKVLMNTGSKCGDHRLDFGVGIESCPDGLFPRSKSFRAGEGLPASHGFWPSLQSRLRNHPLRCKSRSFSDLYPSSLPACRAGLCFPAQSFFSSNPLPFLPLPLHAAPERTFLQIVFATDGFCSRKYVSCSLTTLSTALLASLFPSFCLVCPSNWGSSILTLMIAVRPSRISSPERLGSLSFNSLLLLA